MNPLADTIIQCLREATTAAQIEAVATKYRADVAKMKTDDPARWHHVVNAKREYMRRLKQCPAST